MRPMSGTVTMARAATSTADLRPFDTSSWALAKMATSASASTSAGIDSSTLNTVVSTASTVAPEVAGQQAEQPARPRSPMSTADTLIPSDARAPKITRLSMSRPLPSPPSTWPGCTGPTRTISRKLLSGSGRGSHGATSASSVMPPSHRIENQPTNPRRLVGLASTASTAARPWPGAGPGEPRGLGGAGRGHHAADGRRVPVSCGLGHGGSSGRRSCTGRPPRSSRGRRGWRARPRSSAGRRTGARRWPG